MKIRYLSDLHLEWEAPPADFRPSVGEDLVVLAGDIHVDRAGIEWALKTFTDVPVLYVLGNHEFYGSDFGRVLGDARAMCAGTNVHLLENDAIDIGGIRFLGCTLWTDFALCGAETIAEAMREAKRNMADYMLVRTNGFTLWPGFTADRCAESKAWLSAQIDASPLPVVVVTHHAPTYDTFNGNFERDLMSANFHNDWPEMVRPPVKLWIHGHHHWCITHVHNGIPIVSNQRGYPYEGVPGFEWDRLVEVLP